MVLVDGLTIDYGLGRRTIVVHARLIVVDGVLDAVTVLTHVAVEPVVRVEGLGESTAAGWMEGHEVPALVAAAKTSGERADDVALHIALDRTIAAKNPDQSRVPIPPSEPLAIALKEHYNV